MLSIRKFVGVVGYHDSGCEIVEGATARDELGAEYETWRRAKTESREKSALYHTKFRGCYSLGEYTADEPGWAVCEDGEIVAVEDELADAVADMQDRAQSASN